MGITFVCIVYTDGSVSRTREPYNPFIKHYLYFRNGYNLCMYPDGSVLGTREPYNPFSKHNLYSRN